MSVQPLFKISIVILFIYFIQNIMLLLFFRYYYFTLYIFNCLVLLVLSFFIFYNLYGLDIVTYRVRYDVVIIALVIGVLQVLLTFLLGIYFGFGMNPHSFTPLILLLNSIFYLAPTILLEALRSILLSGSFRPVSYTHLTLPTTERV